MVVLHAGQVFLELPHPSTQNILIYLPTTPRGSLEATPQDPDGSFTCWPSILGATPP